VIPGDEANQAHPGQGEPLIGRLLGRRSGHELFSPAKQLKKKNSRLPCLRNESEITNYRLQEFCGIAEKNPVYQCVLNAAGGAEAAASDRGDDFFGPGRSQPHEYQNLQSWWD